MAFAGHLEGRVPYWDVDPKEGNVEIVGSIAGTPFLVPNGQVRLFSHYLATREHQRFQRTFGAPSGTCPARMTSSGRTLVLLPPGREPFMVKFSFPLTNAIPQWEIQNKRLTLEEIRLSVARSRHLRSEAFVVPEPCGIFIKDLDYAALYRRPALPPRRNLSPGDMVFTAHVLMSKAFPYTRIGHRIFKKSAENQPVKGGFWEALLKGQQHDTWKLAADEWFTSQLAPKLANIVYRGLDKSCTHLELHSQNVDVVVNARGKVREVLVKDLMDGMYDPVALAARGKAPGTIQDLTEPAWGYLEGPGAKYTAATFHEDFLGQLKNPVHAHYYEQHEFHIAVRNELLKIISRRKDLHRLQRYREYQTAHEAGATLWITIDALRSLLIKSNLEVTFRANPAARQFFPATRGCSPPTTICTNGSAGVGVRQYGFAGVTPVAVTRGSDGTILSYDFNLQQGVVA
jgi:hypothetical protein